MSGSVGTRRPMSKRDNSTARFRYTPMRIARVIVVPPLPVVTEIVSVLFAVIHH